MSDQLSTEILNRIRVWEESIRKSYEYVLTIEKLEDIKTSEENYFRYQCGTRITNFHITLTKNNALLEASVIHFLSAFSSGYSGNLLAGNKVEEIDLIRKSLISDCLKKIEWSPNDFTLFFDSIKAKRDGLFAHYDGGIGDYKKESEGIYSRKMTGISMLQEEKENYQYFLNAFLDTLFKKAYR